jgi:hypothetical protein
MKNTTLRFRFLIQASILIPAALAAASSFAAPASGPENVRGVAGRLESITCRGAYSTTKAYADRTINARLETECGRIADSAEARACAFRVIRVLTRHAPDAFFMGSAVAGQRTFQMAIVDGGDQVFSSLREGFHGDTVDGGISLMFNRAGVSNDEYMIEGGDFTGDNLDHMSSLFVPIRRRVVADLYYYFIDGCDLRWTGQE